MRQRLLDATVECLVEHGWSGTSTTLVSQRAGVSRGAQLHHFPTKADLVLAAVEHLSDARARTSSRAAAAELPTGPPPHPRRAGDARRRTSPARCSPPPSSCGSRPAPTPRCARPSARSSSGSAGRRTAPTVELLGVDESRARRPRAGAGHPRPGPRARPGQHAHRRHRAPQPDPRPRGPSVLDASAQVRGDERPRSPAVLADLARRGRPARRPGRAAADDGRAGARRPRPPAGTSPTRSRTWPGPTRSPCSPADRQGRAGTPSCWPRSRTPTASSTPRPPRGADVPPAELLARWRAARAALAEALAAAARGHEAAVVRPADERHLDGHRPVHGDLGARPRRRRRASASSCRADDRVRHVVHLGVRTRGLRLRATAACEPPAPRSGSR